MSMQIEISSRAVQLRLQEPSANRELARVALHEPELARFETCNAVLGLLGDRTAERSDQNRIVGALLRLSQQRRSRLALELLFVAYFPTLIELAGDLARFRRSRDIDDCRAVAIEAFFEATQLVHLDGEDGTAIRLVLKTRQRAIRDADALERVEVKEVPSPEEVCAARSRLAGPEAELLRRESLPLMLELDERLDPLLETHCDEGVSLRETLMWDDRSLFRQLRRLHPEEDLVAVMRRYQRVRARRSRHLRSARKKAQETLSQIRGYLDLWRQEEQ